MAQTFETLTAERDPMYAAMKPKSIFALALEDDKNMAECQRIGGLSGVVIASGTKRDAWLLKLAISALRNQGEPYYR